MTRILLTNDDGYFAPGIRAAKRALEAVPDWEVVIVAPDREQSASSHALTLHRPLRLDQVDRDVYKVDGTPTDCALLGLRGGLAIPPTLVVSGINAGGNMGEDVTYSGTVAAAMEGTILGVPSISVSLVGDTHFETAAYVTVRIVREVLQRGLPPATFLNVNVPDCPLDQLLGISITSQSRRMYEDQVVTKRDPRGRVYFWIAGDVPEWIADNSSDYAAVISGQVSVTPLHLDMTNPRALSELRKWSLSLNNEPSRE